MKKSLLIYILYSSIISVATVKAEVFWLNTMDYFTHWNIHNTGTYSIENGNILDPAIAGQYGILIESPTSGYATIWNTEHLDILNDKDIGFPAGGHTRYLYFWDIYNTRDDTGYSMGFGAGDPSTTEVATAFGIYADQDIETLNPWAIGSGVSGGPYAVPGKHNYDFRIGFHTNNPPDTMNVTYDWKDVGTSTWNRFHIEYNVPVDAEPDRFVKIGLTAVAGETGNQLWINEVEWSDEDRANKAVMFRAWIDEFDNTNNWDKTLPGANYDTVDLGVLDPAFNGESAVLIQPVTQDAIMLNNRYSDRSESLGELGFPAEGETRYLNFWGVYGIDSQTRFSGGFDTGTQQGSSATINGIGFRHDIDDEKLYARYDSTNITSVTGGTSIGLGYDDYDYQIMLEGGPNDTMTVTWRYKLAGALEWKTSAIHTGNKTLFNDRLLKLESDLYSANSGYYVDAIEYTDIDRILKKGSKPVAVENRTSDFPIMAIVTDQRSIDSELSQYVGAANMNMLLAWKKQEEMVQKADNANTPWSMNVDQITEHTPDFETVLADTIGQYSNTYPNLFAITTRDEPSGKDFHWNDSSNIHDGVAAWLRTNTNAKVWTNGFGALPLTTSLWGGGPGDPPMPAGYSHLQYLTDIANNISPDIISIDTYPFVEATHPADCPNETSLVRRDFMHEGLLNLRTVGLANNITYFNIIQAFQTSGLRLPSESELRMHVFASLVYGAKGIAYFAWDDTHDTNIVSKYGAPTTQDNFFNNIANINSEIANLGDALALLTSDHVFWVDGGDEPCERNSFNVPQWGSGSGNGALTNIIVHDIENGELTTEEDGMIGFFHDDGTGEYIMLVNVFSEPDKTAEDTELRFELQFSTGSITELLRLNRTSGELEWVYLDNNKLDITLPGGTGDLFMINQGKPFASFLLGDVNLDGTVDSADQDIITNNLGMTNATHGINYTTGDLNGDGVVNTLDSDIVTTAMQ